MPVSKSLPKAWHAAGYEGRGWQFDGNIVMPCPSLKGSPQADDSCLPELEKMVWLKVTRWCRKRAISKTALRGSMCHHTFSTELVFADGLPSPSSGTVQSSLQCILLPTFLLENLNIYFCSFNAASLQAAPILPFIPGFWCFVKEGKAQRMFWFNSSQGSLLLWKKPLLFVLAAVRSDLQRLPHPVSLSKGYCHLCEMGLTMALLGWVSEPVEDGDFVPFRAITCQTTPLVNKFLLMSSLNIIYTLNS